MIVEEKKAADRICPQMIHSTPEYRWCQGSRCMAWRWANENVAVENPLHVQPRWEARVSTTHGYCGLAGRP